MDGQYLLHIINESVWNLVVKKAALDYFVIVVVMLLRRKQKQMCCIFITYVQQRHFIPPTPKLYETAAFYMYVILVWNEREVS